MTVIFIQASLYGQIIKWYQNHLYLDRKLCGDAKSTKTSSTTSQPEGDDEESIVHHKNELEKEVKKKNPDDNKLARLMSLTFASRRRSFLEKTANTRVSDAISIYPCLMRPIFVSV